MLVLVLGVALAYSVCRADDMGQKAKTVTLTGTLVDVACYLDDGDLGDDHMGMKGCGAECLKGGSPAGLLVDKTLYVMVFPSSAFAGYVGKKVEITGDEYGTNLIPKKASQVNSDGSKKTISIKGKAMM
jgi:hypothetical protein